MMQTWLMKALGNRYPFLHSNPRAGLVHRLDVQTSGPMLVATRADTFEEMREHLHRKRWYKEYITLMHGAVPPHKGCGVLTYRLLTRQDVGCGWRTEVNNKKGEPAETRYQAIASYRSRPHFDASGPVSRYTLLRVHLVTGRTHQIRVHLAELARELGLQVQGIVGDYKYLPRAQVSIDRSICRRVFLHAQTLEFPPPRSWGQRECRRSLRVQCPLPVELRQGLNRLEKDERTTEMLLKNSGSSFRRELSPPAVRANMSSRPGVRENLFASKLNHKKKKKKKKKKKIHDNKPTSIPN
eukprot:NODE_13660_length_1153_cov_6.248538.p1 GENE.NODE_13660_length_1153_cov_6.248538~~NODE_13660_length_1153_cov_6.248538.p1  ORF type:complete len:297 (-),score=75.96 NODE_13660_length_1153_cov_6.248538:94-984(-)